MRLDSLLKKASYFLALASSDLDNFAQQVKDGNGSQYKNYKFMFSDSDFVNDRPGEYIYSYSRLKDGSIIIQYNLLNQELVLIQREVVARSVNATLSDLDEFISKIEELKEMDEMSTSYENPGREMNLLLDSFRSDDTNLLDIVEKSLGVKIPHGVMLGAGAEGEVYDYGNGKIIKFFLLPDKKKDEVLSFLKGLESIKSKHIANVYNSGIAVRVGQKLLVGDLSSFKNPIWIAYYIADKVIPIKGEKDPAKVKNLKEALIKEIGLDPWDFEENPDNTMQDAYGNYVYVDFGSTADFVKV